MRVRLPTVGGSSDPAFEPAAPEATGAPPGEGAPPLVCVAGVSALSPVVPWAGDLVRALVAAGKQPAALRIHRRAGAAVVVARGADEPDGRVLAEAGADPVVVLRTDATHALEGLGHSLAALEGDDEQPVVCVGNDVPALRPSALTILLTGGLPPSSWAASARALAGRVDLELTEPRPGLADALVRAWLTAVATARRAP